MSSGAPRLTRRVHQFKVPHITKSCRDTRPRSGVACSACWAARSSSSRRQGLLPSPGSGSSPTAGRRFGDGNSCAGLSFCVAAGGAIVSRPPHDGAPLGGAARRKTRPLWRQTIDPATGAAAHAWPSPRQLQVDLYGAATCCGAVMLYARNRSRFSSHSCPRGGAMRLGLAGILMLLGSTPLAAAAEVAADPAALGPFQVADAQRTLL